MLSYTPIRTDKYQRSAQNSYKRMLSDDCRPVEALIGNTRLIGFHRVTAHLPQDIGIYAKAEWMNPGGSVKDRTALNIIRHAELSGKLAPGKIILDSTSGNTGIAYAMLGATKGYRVKLFLPESASPERIAVLQAYGAELTFTDRRDGSDGAMQAVRRLAASEPNRYFYADQYNNPANWMAHYCTTGVEIWNQTEGDITHLVIGLGTGGTLVGTGRRMKAYNPNVEVISVQPDSAMHGLDGLKHMPSVVRPGIYDEAVADRNLNIRTEEAYAMARRLANEEGYLVGISSAAAMLGALHVAEELAAAGRSGVIITIFPDNGYKYLSAPVWKATAR